MREPIRNYFKVRTLVANDCVAAVWGEYLLGTGRGYDNLVYITLSTGIGAGVIVDGHLLLGKDGNAHEVGHLVIDYRGIKCGCGGIGHWEAYASGRNLPNLIRILAKDYRGMITEALDLALNNSLTAPKLFRLWSDGDEFANYVVDELARINAAGRIEHAKKAVEILVEQDYEKAIQFADKIEENNQTRRVLDKNITKEALNRVDKTKKSWD